MYMLMLIINNVTTRNDVQLYVRYDYTSRVVIVIIKEKRFALLIFTTNMYNY